MFLLYLPVSQIYNHFCYNLQIGMFFYQKSKKNCIDFLLKYQTTKQVLLLIIASIIAIYSVLLEKEADVQVEIEWVGVVEIWTL